MNEERKSKDTDVIGELIRQAGRRENPSQEEFDRVFAAATAALDHKLRRRRRRFAFMGIAATLILGLAVGIVVSNLPKTATQSLAAVDRIVGPADFAVSGNSNWLALPDDNPHLPAGSRLRTGPASRIGLLMNNGVSLRLAEATIVQFVAPGHIDLVDGKIYADAGAASGERDGVKRIIVDTGAGTTWDVGTQFEVLYVDDLYRLRVREGQVHLEQPSRSLSSEAGEQLSIDAAQTVRRDRIAKDDADWLWAESVAPDPIIDTRPVTALLDWVSRQTGRDVAFTSFEVEIQAATTILHGSVQFLEPLEALETMLATTDLDYTLLEDGTILIDAK